MKPETATLLKKHLENNKFEFTNTEEGLAFNYELTDDEVLEIVNAEYGPNLVGDVEELFKSIVKKLVKLGAEHGKKAGTEEK
jgi:hypothetical protein